VTETVGAEVIEIVDGKIKEVLDYQSPTVGQGRVATSQARSVSGRHQRTGQAWGLSSKNGYYSPFTYKSA
jgi:hypothetical protein